MARAKASPLSRRTLGFVISVLALCGGVGPAFAQDRLVGTVPEHEPNDSCPGQAVSNITFIDPASLAGIMDMDYYTFTATAGMPITLGTEDPGGYPYSDTIVDLFYGCNNLLTSDGDSGPRWYSLIYRYPAPYTGTYSMRVRGGSTGSSPYRGFIFVGEPPTGACCLPTSACQLKDRVVCRQVGGVFYGEGTPCNAVQCPAPITNETCATATPIPSPGSGVLTGHLGYAHNDYDPWAPSCTGSQAEGLDVVYRVDLEPEDVLQLSYTELEANGSIYIVTDCNDVPTSCVAGADAAGYQQTETITFVAGTTAFGACCIEGGICQFLTEAGCSQVDGIFRGNWTNCDPGDCYMLRGACCFGGGGCIDDLSPWDCARSGGHYVGDGDRCYWGPCPQPTGACCVNGDCTLFSALDCALAHGLFLGGGTPCDPDPCTAGIGACCYPDQTCRTLTLAECTAAAGVYQGDGVSCVDVTCGAATGACCLTTGACMELTQYTCSDLDGTWYGQFDCNPNPCPAKTQGEEPRAGSAHPPTKHADTGAQTYFVILDSRAGESGGPWTLSYSITRPSAVLQPASTAGTWVHGTPNPFGESTQIYYQTETDGPARLEVFDAGGRRVRSLGSEAHPPSGSGAVLWDGRDDAGARVPAGVYFARLTAGKAVATRTMVRVR